MFSSLISKLFNDLPSNFGYIIGDKVKGEDYSIWTHYRGYKKNKPEQSCSVFVFDKSQVTNSDSLGFIPRETTKKLAKNQFQKCKSLIHPSILKVYDTLEVPNSYYIITEPCVSLYTLAISSSYNFKLYTDDTKETEYDVCFPKDCISGIYDIINGLKFLHNDGKLLHGNISPLNIFVNFEGSWKLGGFENTILLSDAGSYYIDDISKQSTAYNIIGWKFPKGCRNPKNLDLWNLGCLIYWSYQVSSKTNSLENNGILVDQSNIENRRRIIESLKLPYSNGDILTMENNLIPTWLYDWLSDILTCINTNREINIESGLNLINNNSPFVELMNQLNNFMLKSFEDKKVFCTQYLPHLLTSIKIHGVDTTNVIITHRIIEKLLFNFCQCTSSVFPLLLTLLEPYDYSNCPKIILRSFHSVLKFLFNQNDRSIRYTLLKNIAKYERFLVKDIFQSCIDSILMGFQDTANVIRETTLQSMIFIIPLLLKEDMESRNSIECDQLSKGNIKSNTSNDFMYSIKEGWKKNSAAILNAFASNNNSQVLVDKLVCSMLNLSKDSEVIVRSNTVICFAKLMNILPEQYHLTILNKVYLNSLKDPFPICRKAVVQAFLSTIHYYPPIVITQQILPSVSINGFAESQPEIMEISLNLIKNITHILSPYVQEQIKLKEEESLKVEEQCAIQNDSKIKKDSNLQALNSQNKSSVNSNIQSERNSVLNNEYKTSNRTFETEQGNTEVNNIGNFSNTNNNNINNGIKTEINWNDFDNGIFDLKISKDIKFVSESSKRNNKSNIPITTQSGNQNNIINLKPEINDVSNVNFSNDHKRTIDNFSLKKERNSNFTANLNNSKKDDKLQGKKLSTKLDLDNDDFWKEFE